MTAEVSVMNSLGVALAADSAVTLGGAGKIYASADKLFELSRAEPMAVMVYGNAGLLGVPWETAIKIYRKELGANSFETVEDQAKHFIRFLERNRQLFPAAARSKYARWVSEQVTKAYFAQLKEAWQQALNKRQRARAGSLTEQEATRIAQKLAREFLAAIRKMPKIDECPKTFLKTLRSGYSREVGDGIQGALGKTKLVSLLSRTLRSAVFEFLQRLPPELSTSGVVIAGFGTKQHFPALVRLDTDGMVGARLRCRIAANVALAGPDDARVMTFAQSEMVQTFMNGIDPYLHNVMMDATSKVFEKFSARVVDKTKKHSPKAAAALQADLPAETRQLLRDLNSELNDEQDRSYIQPVMSVVAALPKDELGEMAEALVNLTKFKRRVSTQQETVGGPIDVAVITKGDGFVWTRRKHYFDPRLNPRYFVRQERGSN